MSPDKYDHPRVTACMLEVIEVCKRHGLALHHEDSQGGFLLSPTSYEPLGWESGLLGAALDGDAKQLTPVAPEPVKRRILRYIAARAEWLEHEWKRGGSKDLADIARDLRYVVKQLLNGEENAANYDRTLAGFECSHERAEELVRKLEALR